ncbi:SurA N-terminal domain-containing protein [Paraliobacillus sediminis]|uniref:SurA N-terminal domain-containing protein n=1 Tax=Paraliobacillus sediminis TaxID=1885916 RepID=UPI000E3C548F|nr:SurA N-terminal domain-containing protein [Paraliobacillus sediminis]
MNKKWLVSLLLVLFVLVLAACNDDDETADDTNDDTASQEEETSEDSETANTEQPEMPEADLEGIPEVVAEVNGEEIQRETFETTYQGQLQQVALQSQMSGEAAEIDQDQLKTQVAEGMVGQELLIQEANNRDYEASEEAIDEVLNNLVEQNGLETQEDFLVAIEEQGTDREEVMSQIELQVKVDQLIASESEGSEPTDEEIQAYYDQVVEQQEQTDGEAGEIPSFEDAKPQIAEQLKSQKQAEVTQTLIDRLREDAEVTINL